eukprot:1173761-Prymnesium_polylepis.1
MAMTDVTLSDALYATELRQKCEMITHLPCVRSVSMIDVAGEEAPLTFDLAKLRSKLASQECITLQEATQEYPGGARSVSGPRAVAALFAAHAVAKPSALKGLHVKPMLDDDR